ncbi:MAG: NYN domain-containing protein [Clostridia bacterium]|jgi:uncharacterized LabA/DUF88 family protein
MLKTAIFIDLTDIYYRLLKSFGTGKLDFAKFLGFLKEAGYDIQKSIAYGCQTEREASSFIGFLRSLGFTTRYKHPYILKVNDRKIKRCNWTVGLTIDIIRTVASDNQLDAVIICSSNPDLLPMVKYVREEMGFDNVFLMSVDPPPNLVDAVKGVFNFTEGLLDTNEPD